MTRRVVIGDRADALVRVPVLDVDPPLAPFGGRSDDLRHRVIARHRF